MYSNNVYTPFHIAGNLDVGTLDSQYWLPSKGPRCINENNFIISYLNVEKGLIVKGKDVENDDVLITSDVFGIGESCLLKDNEFPIDGFQSIFKNVGNGQGSAAYMKENLMFHSETFSNDKISAIFLSLDKLDIIFLYISG